MSHDLPRDATDAELRARLATISTQLIEITTAMSEVATSVAGIVLQQREMLQLIEKTVPIDQWPQRLREFYTATKAVFEPLTPELAHRTVEFDSNTFGRELGAELQRRELARGWKIIGSANNFETKIQCLDCSGEVTVTRGLELSQLGCLNCGRPPRKEASKQG